MKFLRLVERISTGAKIEINKVGTFIKYYPGVLTNNDGVIFEFDCGLQRGISYFLEGILLLCIFGKTSLNLLLKGTLQF